MHVAGDILWYRGFHDVPRVFAVAGDEGVYVFESRFDGARDDYDDAYDVWWIPTRDAAPDALLAIAASQAPVGRVAVSSVTFDSTRRHSMRVSGP